jgi:DNA mismatch repair ATPase MutL
LSCARGARRRLGHGDSRHGGAVASVAETGAPEGTSIEVSDLFYNLPARRKFMKSDAAEAAQVSRVVTQLALCYPEIGFTLTSSGRKVLQCPPVTSLRDRLYQLYGERGDLIEVRRDRGDVKVTGYIAALAEQGPTRGPQNVFVNRRIVKDRTIAHAIIDSYSVASIKERSPEVHLFIEMPFDALDVNVHPTKAEVRFRDQSFMHEVIRRTLGDALGRGPARNWCCRRRPRSLRSRRHCRCQPVTARRSRAAGQSRAPHLLHRPAKVALHRPAKAALRPISEPGLGPTREGDIGPTIRPLIPLGQFRDTFIVAVDEKASRSSTSMWRTSECCSNESPSG